jgi:hypothetical protein
VTEPDRVDDVFFFTARAAEAAAAMRVELDAQGWSVAIRRRRRLVVRRVWSVQAHRPSVSVPEDEYEDVVAAMERLARRHGASVDAWGLPTS